MEGNNNKLLYRLIFALTFIVLATVAALFWFYPNVKGEEGTIFAGGNTSNLYPESQLPDVTEWVNNEERFGEEFPPLEDPAPVDVQQDSEKDQESTLSINVNQERRAEEKDEIIETVVPKEATPVVEKVAPPAPKPETVSKPAPKPVVKTIKVKAYQIQVGSYTDRYRAEETKTLLQEKGLISMVTVTEKNGTSYFRVRLGPYGNKNEAEKFLSQVKDIQGFADSYISMIYVEKQITQ